MKTIKQIGFIALAIMTLAVIGCKDEPDPPPPNPCTCPNGTEHDAPCTCGGDDCHCTVKEQPILKTPKLTIGDSIEITVEYYDLPSADEPEYLAVLQGIFNTIRDSTSPATVGCRNDLIATGGRFTIIVQDAVPAYNNYQTIPDNNTTLKVHKEWISITENNTLANVRTAFNAMLAN